MAESTNTWKVGDKFMFTESPLPNPLPPATMAKKFTLGIQSDGMSNEWFEVDLSYNGVRTSVTVSTRWIKKPDSDE